MQALTPDMQYTKRWCLPNEDPDIHARNIIELRTLLAVLWKGADGNGLRGLVCMLFSRFGCLHGNGAQAMPENAEQVMEAPINGDLRYLTEIEFQLGRRAEAHFTPPGQVNTRSSSLIQVTCRSTPTLGTIMSQKKTSCCFIHQWMELNLPLGGGTNMEDDTVFPIHYTGLAAYVAELES